jgi:GT2 family glycosyltransferase
VLHDNSVKALSDWLDTHPECGVCGGNLVDGRGRPAHSFHRVLPGMVSQWNELLCGLPFLVRFGRNKEFNHTGRPMQVGYITGADMMVRAEVLAQTGGFDPDFFLYYEETELTSRICRAGYSVVNIPWVVITHLHSKSFKGDSRRSKFLRHGEDLYMRKVYGLEGARRINRLSILASRLKAIVLFWNPRMRRKLRERLEILTR